MGFNKLIVEISALLFSTALFQMANGLQGTLLGVRAGIEGFSTQFTGLIMTAYFLGYILGSSFIPKFVEKIGHIRTFTSCASLVSVSSLLHGYFVDPLSWFVLRTITGVAIYGLYVVVESWINTKAESSNRGKVFSTYMIINLGALTLGQFILNLDSPDTIGLFVIISVLFSLSVLPIAMTKFIAPDPIPNEKMRISRLFKISQLGTFAIFITGLSNSAFWGMSGIYAFSSGLTTSQISLFVGLIIFGGIVFQAPIGALSDKFDRRMFVILTSGMHCFLSLLLAISGTDNLALFYILSFIFGGFMLCVYSVCTALINDRIDHHDMVRASGTMLLLFGVGAILGPISVSFLMEAFGNAAFFVFMSVTQFMVVLFAIYRHYVGRSYEIEDLEPLVPVTPMSGHLTEFDPRLAEDDNDNDNDKKED